MRKKKEQIQDLTNAISKIIRRTLDEQEKQILQKNSSKNHSTQNKAKKSAQQEQYQIHFKIESLYDELVNVLWKLKKIVRRMNSINKLSKQKLNIFNAKLNIFITDLQNLIQTKGFNIRIDKYVGVLVQQTNKCLTQGDRILTSLQKQTGVFCCGGIKQTKYTFYRAIINIIGYGHVWSIIPKFSPLVQQKIQKFQIFTPIKYDIGSLQKLIQKEISKYWPDEPSLKQPDLCQRPHVDSQIIQSKQSAVSSQSQSQVSEPKVLNQQPPNNYIKIEEITRLKQDLQIETLLRQTHQKLFGFGRPQQISAAIEGYRKLVDKKNQKSPLAYNALGQIYEEGKFVDADRQKSQQYYRRSAGQGNAEGLYKIGKYLEKGLIRISDDQSDIKRKRQDQLRATIQYYQKAAQSNHLDAITDLGFIYEKGIENGKSFLDISNVSRSQNNSSEVYEKKTANQKYFIQPNINFAIKYYTIAKKSQFPRAINNLGALLIRQHQSISERVKGINLEKGIKYLKKSAQMNYFKSYFNLGKCYQNGIGVEQSYETAKKYYLRGSQKGDISCKLQYIKCFFADGFPKNGQTDDSQIAKLIQLINEVLTIEPKSKQCLFYMGLFYQRGDGVIKNPELAYNYVHKSASLNFLPAITKLGDYKYSGFYVKKDLEEAVNLYEKAASKGQPQAMINLSLILQKGLIKPTKGSSPDFIKHLQGQALKTKTSNAYLIAGLRDTNYRIDRQITKGQLNSNILKSLELGNRDTINLIQKINKNKKSVQKQKKQINKNEVADLGNKMIRQGMKMQKTVKNNQLLKRVKSADNLKTTRI